ncbi:MAG: ADP-ribosyl-[dinitrogen reductase] hydrolase [Rhodocyclaceae bacterium]|nr:ADP-ribosyl-[dinitrogen reductase] hydrolase [Rhodocyclaceae bacterium]
MEEVHLSPLLREGWDLRVPGPLLRGVRGLRPLLRAGSLSAGERLSRARGAYLGLAVGDALGATVEFMTPAEIRHAFARQGGMHREMVGGGWLRLAAGQVTDDTTMSLALGESILAEGRVDALAAARAFDAWMRGKPVDIGNTVRRGLVEFRRTGNPERSVSEHDAGNGAAMRVLPVALATLGQPDPAVAEAVRRQAHVTHHNALSDAAATTLALMVQDLVNGATPPELLERRARPLAAIHPEFAFGGRRKENPSGFVADTVIAVFQAFFGSGSFADCLVEVVNRGGDADTTGAIAGMLAGARYGEDGIPARWLRTLGAPVRAACAGQAERLIALANT